MTKSYLKNSEVKINVCPVTQLLNIISGRWTNEILWNLAEKRILRFGQLKAELLGITTKVLTERLRMLEDNGIVCREHIPSIPPSVNYSLTPMGKNVCTAINGLKGIAVELSLSNEKHNNVTLDTTT